VIAVTGPVAAERLDPAEALEFARELRALLPDR
jgi:hypothetical protein